jgi:restriction system protein
MELPKFHETFMPILEVLSNGETLHYNDLRIQVREKFYSNLPKELLELKTKNGDLLILNRIGWGKGYLKQAKLVEQPERALVKITEKGKLFLKEGNLTLKKLKSDPDFLAYENLKKINKSQDSDDLNQDLENSSPQDMIDSGIEKIEIQVKSDLLNKLKVIDPYYFEKVILILLQKMGYGDFQETRKSNDGGIDGVINEDKLGLEKIYIQAKRYNENKVREKEIRNFIGAMSGDTTKGIFVTTSTFDESAIKKAKEAHHKIILIDGMHLVNLMHQYNVGVQVINSYEVKSLDEDFFETN